MGDGWARAAGPGLLVHRQAGGLEGRQPPPLRPPLPGCAVEMVKALGTAPQWPAHAGTRDMSQHSHSQLVERTRREAGWGRGGEGRGAGIPGTAHCTNYTPRAGLSLAEWHISLTAFLPLLPTYLIVQCNMHTETSPEQTHSSMTYHKANTREVTTWSRNGHHCVTLEPRPAWPTLVTFRVLGALPFHRTAPLTSLDNTSVARSLGFTMSLVPSLPVLRSTFLHRCHLLRLEFR